MGTKVLDALTNNKLVAGVILMVLTLSIGWIGGMKSEAAGLATNEIRLQAVESKVKTIDALNEFRVRYEEREKNRDQQITRMEEKLDRLLEK